MALVKLQRNWGVAGSVSGRAWVEGLRFCANAAVGGFGDHEKLETKPRSLQDLALKPFMLKTFASNLNTSPQSTKSEAWYGTVVCSSTVVAQ